MTLLLAIVAASGTSIATGILTRPKMKADAKTAEATGEVAISGDAREWAKTFAERADKADARADEAEARAETAEHEVAAVKVELKDCKEQCEVLATRLDNWQVYAVRLQRDLEAQGIAVPPPPE